MRKVIVKIPFEGFYASLYSQAIDSEEEQFAEYHTNDYEKDSPDYEGYWPEQLRLEARDYADILFDVTTYRVAYEQLASDYVEAFDAIAGEILEFSVKAPSLRYDFEKREHVQCGEHDKPTIRATFESMESPKYYNFETDRLFAEIPLAIMYLLFRRSRAEKHETLSRVIRERFTSRDGFIPHYRNQLGDWLEKPLSDWDHNEFETLLIAAMQMAGEELSDSDQMRWQLYEATCGDEGAYQAWSEAVDWDDFEEKRAEKRAEKLSEWIEEDIDAAANWSGNNADDFAIMTKVEPALKDAFDGIPVPYRCPFTADLFA